MATGDLRARGEIKQFGDIKDHASYHIPDRFLDRFATHIAKNLLIDGGANLGSVPLISASGVGRVAGKSFNLELCRKRLGVFPVVVSAGELEDPTAGEPGAMLRRRYLTAGKHMSASARRRASSSTTWMRAWDGSRTTRPPSTTRSRRRR